MDTIRQPFQGVWNIIRFNWQFYVLALALVWIIFLSKPYLNDSLGVIANISLALIAVSTVVSLLVSCYVYDFSSLYQFSWLDKLPANTAEKIINIHAGFDETSVLLQSKFPQASLSVLDFYDPSKHTEISIERARKAYPPFPNTQQVTTHHLPFPDHSVDKIFIFFSAHEIRNDAERIVFFQEIHRILAPDGQIIVTEHLRDTANFLAYNIGCFHFHSKATWLKTFTTAGLNVAREIKITPFITTFSLNKNGTAP
jgi:ubiquinone/menaquinone biosynthesis C-methylase UbiE